MLYNALYTVLYIATYTNSNSTIKKVTIAYDRCMVRDDACQRPSPPVCTVINTRERTDQKPPYEANQWGPFGVPRRRLLAPGRAGDGREQGRGGVWEGEGVMEQGG